MGCRGSWSRATGKTRRAHPRISRFTMPLSEARSVVLRGSGYETQDEAMVAGQLWRSRLMRAFATIRIGADFGDRAPKGAFTMAGLESFGLPGRQNLDDVHGLMVFEGEPAPSS